MRTKENKSLKEKSFSCDISMGFFAPDDMKEVVLVEDVIQSIDELKEYIIKNGFMIECEDYCKDCVQCEFWKKFNEIFGFDDSEVKEE